MDKVYSYEVPTTPPPPPPHCITNTVAPSNITVNLTVTV